MLNKYFQNTFQAMQQHVFQVYSNAPDCTRIRHFNAPNSKMFLGRGPSPLPRWGGGHPSPHPTPSAPWAPRPPPPPPLKIPGSATGIDCVSSFLGSFYFYFLFLLYFVIFTFSCFLYSFSVFCVLFMYILWYGPSCLE